MPRPPASRPPSRPHACRLVHAALALAAAAAAAPAGAAWMRDGIPVAPAGGAQLEPAILADGEGGVFIAWADRRGPADSVFLVRLGRDAAPRFAARGVIAGRENLAVAPDGEGGIYVAADLAQASSSAQVHHLSSRGLAFPRWPLSLPYIASLAAAPGGGPEEAGYVLQSLLVALAPDPAGGVIAAWTHSLLSDDHSHVARFKADSEPPPGWSRFGFRVAAADTFQIPAAVCADDSGGAWLAYVGHLPAPRRVYAYHLSWNAARSAFFAATDAAREQDGVSVVPDGSGGALVAWQDRAVAGGPLRVYLQRLTRDGIAPGWPRNGLAVCEHPTRAGTRRVLNGAALPAVTLVADGAGGAYLAWTDDRPGSSAGDVYVQRIRGDATRAPGWPENGLAVCRAAGAQTLPRLAAEAAGGVLVVWQDARSGEADVYGQRLDAEGRAAWAADGAPLSAAAGAQESPVVTSDGADGAYVAWVDRRDGPAGAIWALHVGADGTVPVPGALVSAEADASSARLEWWVGAARAALAIERRGRASAWRVVGEAVPDGEGRVRFVDREVAPGDRFGYRLREPGAQDGFGEAWIEIPGVAGLALDPPRPHPCAGEVVVALELPDAAPGTLELLDVAGRRLERRAVGGAAGRRLARLAPPGLAPGLYLLRLSHGGRSLARRVVVVR